MADHSHPGAEFPQDQNEQLVDAERIAFEDEVEDEYDEDRDEDYEEEEEDEDDEEYVSHVDELVSHGDEEGEEDEARLLGDEDSEGNVWNNDQIDGLFCPICMEAWTNNGDHHICCLPCGHIYGMSCIHKWLERFRNQGKCPQCNRRCALNDVRKLFASRVVAIDEEAHKRIQSLENICASLEKKRAGWRKKEANWRKREAELQVEVEQLREINKSRSVYEQLVKQEVEQKLATFQQRCDELLGQKLAESERHILQTLADREQKWAKYKQQMEQKLAKYEHNCTSKKED